VNPNEMIKSGLLNLFALLIFSKNCIASKHEIQWQKNETWFYNEVKRECCPYVKAVYSPNEQKEKCCRNRLHEIKPLQAIGGPNFSHFSNLIRTETSILILGDSLAEQHFVFMLCHAWSHGEKVQIRRIKREFNIMTEENEEGLRMYEAKIGKLKITGIKWYPMTLVPTVNIEEPDFMLVSAWHHEPKLKHPHRGREAEICLREYFSLIKDKRSKPTIFIEAFPGHFPGGFYNPAGNYPEANIRYRPQKHPVCDTNSYKSLPNINFILEELVEEDENLFLLRLNHLLMRRGDASVGKIAEGRDCLHYCVVPGIFDAVAKRSIAMISNIRENKI